jgi:streptogramin lyase
MKTLFFCFVSGLWLMAVSRVHSQAFSFTTLTGSASQGSTDGLVTNARFFAPQGVSVDAQGNVYVADSDNSTIRAITPGGLVTTIAGQAGVAGYADGTGTNTLFFLPKSLVGDASGNLYVVDTWNQVIRKLTPVGTNWVVSTLAGQVGIAGYADGTGTNAQFSTPARAAVDAAGNVYVADQGNDVIRKITPLGMVTTIAGQVGSNNSLDGTNGNAQFASPAGITMDNATNLYVTDGDNTIRRMMPVGTNWVVTTIAGQTNNYGSTDGLGTNALFWGPAGITVDTNGSLYVADSFNKTVRKLTPTGTNWVVSTLAGLAGAQGSTDGTNSAARFGSPVGVATDSAGDVFVADVNNNNIRKITPVGTNGVVTTLAGIGPGNADGPGPTARFWSTTGVAVDTAGNVFVADYYNSTIRRITTNDVVSTIAGLAGSTGSSDGTNSDARFYDPLDVTVDSQGNVYVTDIFNNTIRKITPMGTNWVVTTIAGNAGVPPGEADGTGTNALFYNPTGIAVDANTNLYVTDSSGQTIRKITPVGTNWVVTTIAGLAFATGSSNGIGTNAQFFYPHGIAVDAATNVYVADSVNDTIRRLSPVGTNWVVTTIAGQAQVGGSTDGTGTNALFYFPEGIVLDNTGNLYVADTFNDTLRRLTPVGTNWSSTTLAGQVQITGSTDGTGTNALFYLPEGIALDNTGNLYVADTYNNAIRFGRAIIPSLQIAPVANSQVILSWPTWAYSFVLETSSNVSPGAVWTPLTNGVMTVGGNLVLTNNINAPTAFYRLHGQ